MMAGDLNLRWKTIWSLYNTYSFWQHNYLLPTPRRYLCLIHPAYFWICLLSTIRKCNHCQSYV